MIILTKNMNNKNKLQMKSYKKVLFFNLNKVKFLIISTKIKINKNKIKMNRTR